MKPEDFDFELPAGQIAQRPAPSREGSRLFCLHRTNGAFEHRTFSELPERLRRGDLLVLNDTRVVPARLLGRKVGTGGRAELLLVHPSAPVPTPEALASAPASVAWICLGQASKPLRPGTRLAFEGGLTAEIAGERGGGEYVVQFASEGTEPLSALLERVGRVPLPPYIEREPSAEDAARYQTVYARVPGSVAAPTAGLHFTESLFAELEARGIERTYLTLEVGPGTFLPVREGSLDAHVMHAERYHVPEETARRVTQARAEGRRIVAVGTTSVRTLEAAWNAEQKRLSPGPGETALFIRPGHVFGAVDGMITNFHLPRSTLLMLVSAFAGRERVLAAYREAVERGYRFFSYGDAMWIGE